MSIMSSGTARSSQTFGTPPQHGTSQGPTQKYTINVQKHTKHIQKELKYVQKKVYKKYKN